MLRLGYSPLTDKFHCGNARQRRKAMTNLEVSCPYCGKMVVVGMEHEDNPVAGLFDKMLGDTKQYSFNGDEMCACGKW